MTSKYFLTNHCHFVYIVIKWENASEYQKQIIYSFSLETYIFSKFKKNKVNVFSQHLVGLKRGKHNCITVPVKEDIRTNSINNNFPEILKHIKHYLLFPSYLFNNFYYKFSKNKFLWSGVSKVKLLMHFNLFCVFKIYQVIKRACDFGFIPKSSFLNHLVWPFLKLLS